MKIRCCINKFSGVSAEDKKALIVMFRRKSRVYINNFEWPEDRVKVSFNEETRKINLEIDLNEDEYFGIGTAEGMAQKRKLINGKLKKEGEEGFEKDN